MDKYEYKLKAEEIVRLAGRKQYKAAAKIADEIRWEKVKNIQMLCTVADIYERVGMYEESIEVLLQAQRRSPNGKAIAYKLVELYIELKDYEEAAAFYHEYMQLAPNDSNALLLKYKLYKARGARLETQIAILEEFKSRDYQEEWILELARLYHQAGQGDRCVELCDDIDLWFNSGTTVMRALELKRMYAPLTVVQEQKLADWNHSSYQAPQEEYVAQETYAPQEEYVAQETYAPQEEYVAQETYAPQPEENNSLTDVEAVAETIIQMARPGVKNPGEELQQGFSILPKENVVKADAQEFAFDLPEGVEKTELIDAGKLAKEPEEARAEEETVATVVDDKESAETPETPEKPSRTVEITEQEYERVLERITQEIDVNGIGDAAQEEKTTEEYNEESGEQTEESEIENEIENETEETDKPKGIFGKMISRLTMEDDELDDDFNDDYDDSDDFIDDDEEDGMVTRGLTGQYEKINIDEDEDENDPLNVRLTSPIPPVEKEETEEYEYVYDEDDEYDEYEALEDTDEYGDFDDDEEYEESEEEQDSQTRGNKRFRFFRNTMEDDEEEEEIMEQVIPLSYATKYDTLNLQKELAKSIQQLMDATEKETVDSTLENVKKMVEQSNIPELTETMRFKAIRGNMLNSVAKRQAQKLQQAKEIEEVVKHNAANVETEPTEDATVSMVDARPKPAVELAIKLKPAVEDVKVPIESILTQEDDGQLSLAIPEEEMVEKQITGQLNIEDVLREWEKQEIISESDREKRALEEARKRALEETQGIMAEIMGLLKDVIPKIGAIKDGEEKMSVLAESLERVQKSLPFTQGVVEAAEESKVAASAIEAACAEAVLELEQLENDRKAIEQEKEELKEEQMALLYTHKMPVIAEEMYAATAQDAEVTAQDDEVTAQDAEATAQDAEAIAQDAEAVAQDAEATAQDAEATTQDAEATTQHAEATAQDVETVAQDADSDYSMETPVQEVSEELMPEMEVFPQNLEEAILAQTEEELQKKASDEETLNEEQKDILAYFLAIDSLKGILQSIVKRTESAPEHMIVTGDVGSGKTSVAMRIIKAAQVNKEEKVETIAKIKADLLNQKQITEIFDKVNGGVLIIENAGSLKPTTVYAIEEALYSNEYYVQIILADKKEAIGKLLGTTRSFLNDIQMRVDLPVYSNNELAEFAKTYAEVNGYSFDGMALLALHSVIDLFQTDEHVTNLEDMKNIMDEAMERADRRNKKLFGKLFGKKNSEGIVLVESDFE